MIIIFDFKIEQNVGCKQEIFCVKKGSKNWQKKKKWKIGLKKMPWKKLPKVKLTEISVKRHRVKKRKIRAGREKKNTKAIFAAFCENK